MIKIFASLFLFVLVSFSAFVGASVRKRVSFQDCKTDSNEPTKGRGTLIDAILSLPHGEALKTNIFAHYGIEDEKDLTDSLITKFLVLDNRTSELFRLEDNLVVDEEVLDAFCGFVDDHHLYESNFVLQSFPALASQDSLTLMGRDVCKFKKVLHMISRYEPVSFVDALPAIREAVSNSEEYMNLMWLCVRTFSFAGTCSRSARDRKSCFQKLAIEFLNCTKVSPFIDVTKLLSLSFEAKEIVISLAIELGCTDFLQLLLLMKVFVPDHRFESGVVSGNAFMFVRGNAQVLRLLIDAKVPLEEVVISRYSRQGVSVISIFFYLFLQGHEQMNEILMSLEYTPATYLMIARESVRYDIPEIAEFALSRCAKVREVILQAEQEKRAMIEKLESDRDCILNEEGIEDTGYSHHGL